MSDSLRQPPGQGDPAGILEAARKLAGTRQSLADEVRRVVVGMDHVIDRFLVALIAGGHALFEGVPGTAKTTLVRVVATALGTDFARLQFTPDLLPGDVTGTHVYDRRSGEFVLKTGPIFTHVLLVDEINRATAKTQSALLEAMQENQVTIEGETLPLPEPFMVLATQNPIEEEGVYRLPEAQLDRFLLRVPFDYPSRDEELAILDLHGSPVAEVSPVLSPERIMELRRQVQGVHVAPTVREYIVDVARRSREHPDLALGASPRAALCHFLAARAHAFVSGSVHASHDDAKRVAVDVLGHRLILRPEAAIAGKGVEEIIGEILESITVLEPLHQERGRPASP